MTKDNTRPQTFIDWRNWINKRGENKSLHSMSGRGLELNSCSSSQFSACAWKPGFDTCYIQKTVGENKKAAACVFHRNSQFRWVSSTSSLSFLKVAFFWAHLKNIYGLPQPFSWELLRQWHWHFNKYLKSSLQIGILCEKFYARRKNARGAVSLPQLGSLVRQPLD